MFHIYLIVFAVSVFVGNRVGACNISKENANLLKSDSISPADSIYYEPVMFGNGHVIGAFHEIYNDSISQTRTKENSIKVYDVVESLPQFPGGLNGLMSWLSHNIIYPSEAVKARKEGKVVVQFVIKKDGSIGDAKIVVSVDSLLDAEALRIVKSMPVWLPGKQNGEPVNVRFTLPISFKL